MLTTHLVCCSRVRCLHWLRPVLTHSMLWSLLSYTEYLTLWERHRPQDPEL